MTTWAAINNYLSKFSWILIDAQAQRNTVTNTIRHKFVTDKCSNQLSYCDADTYADFIVTAISIAVHKAISTSKLGCSESQPVSEESLALIKEKRRLSPQYSHAHDPFVKTQINQLQKEIKDNLRIESQAS